MITLRNYAPKSYTRPWGSLTWLLYNLQLDDVTCMLFLKIHCMLLANQKRQRVWCIIIRLTRVLFTCRMECSLQPVNVRLLQLWYRSVIERELMLLGAMSTDLISSNSKSLTWFIAAFRWGTCKLYLFDAVQRHIRLFWSHYRYFDTTVSHQNMNHGSAKLAKYAAKTIYNKAKLK